MFNLTTILGALPGIGPIISAAPAVKKFVDEAIAALHPHDQAAAKNALADIMRENDDAHAARQKTLRG